MAVTHTFQQPSRPMNGPHTLHEIYNCKVIDTGERLVHNASLMYGQSHLEEAEVQKVIAIKFPEPEFNRFCQNWEEYMTIMTAIKNNPIAREQYYKLLTYSNLVK